MLRRVASDHQELTQPLQLLGQLIIFIEAGAAFGVDVTL
jgi:hypothetical protein